jgi:hypothetical protein
MARRYGTSRQFGQVFVEAGTVPGPASGQESNLSFNEPISASQFWIMASQ